MAEDRKDQSQSGPKAASPSETPGAGSAIPNRDRRREPPIIDAKPGDVQEVKPATTGEAAKTAAEAVKQPVENAAKPASEPLKPPESAKAPAAAASAQKPKDAPGNSAVPATTTPRPRAFAGAGAMFLAGVAGGALALGGGYALFSSKFYSARQVDAALVESAASLRGSTDSAQKKFDEQSARQSALLDDAAKRIATLEAQAKKLSGDISAIGQTAAKPNTNYPPSVDLGPIEAGLGELEKRIAAIEVALSAPKTPVRASDPEVTQPPAANTPAVPSAAIVPPAIIADLSALSQRLRTLESRPPQQQPDLAPLLARLQQLEQRVAPLADKLAPIESSIGSQTKTIEAGRERADAAALSVVARALADAVNSGAPYANMLKAAQAVGADANAIKALEKSAAKGVPSTTTLATQFAPLGTAIVDLANKPDANASFGEKLASSASKLVRVRPADDTQDETPSALVTRIAVALRASKPEEALALFDKLAPPLRAPAKTWAESLRERVDADRAISTIMTAALARLSRQ